MDNSKTFLAIIPARGGSKRLPGKNVRLLSGKPLITWSIEAGLKSKYVNRVLVSSDDVEILTIAQSSGAETTLRPAVLAQDNSTSFDVIKHAVESTKKPDYVILLQPTSPLRTNKHIDEAIDLLFEKNADAVISVTPLEHNPDWVNFLPSDGSMEGFLKKEIINSRSQDLKQQYRLNGAIYICRTDKLLDHGSFFLDRKIYAYLMRNEASVDIDTEMDFQWAQFLITNREPSRKPLEIKQP